MRSVGIRRQPGDFELRPYQTKAIKDILAYVKKHPTGRLLVVCPPGGGKTLIIANVLMKLVIERDVMGLVVAHRREMVEHHFKHLLKCGIPRELLGIIMGSDSRTSSEAAIQVASVDTLNRRSKPDAAVLVTDEAHRDASRCRRLLRALYPEAFRLGATATPTRLDSKGLKDDFDDMLVVSSISELIVDGYLSAPKVFTVPSELLPDVKNVRFRAGEYAEEDLEKAVNKRVLVGGIVEHWLRIARERRTVIFAASIKHSKHIIEQFFKARIPAAHLDQGTPNAVRKTVLSKLETGEIKIVSCVNILAEGWDCPPCKCVVLARPTMSFNLHIQQTGRCMRPWEAVVPLILDHAGNTLQHGLPQTDWQWSLDNDRQDPGGQVPVKVCPNCERIIAAGLHECPECGYLFEHTPAILDELSGTLTQYQMTATDKEKEMSRLLMFAKEKGFANPFRWALRVYQAKYG